jgi:hypothetical protein
MDIPEQIKGFRGSRAGAPFSRLTGEGTGYPSRTGKAQRKIGRSRGRLGPNEAADRVGPGYFPFKSGTWKAKAAAQERATVILGGVRVTRLGPEDA